MSENVMMRPLDESELSHGCHEHSWLIRHLLAPSLTCTPLVASIVFPRDSKQCVVEAVCCGEPLVLKSAFIVVH